MARRRSSPDALEIVNESRWLVVRDVCSRPCGIWRCRRSRISKLLWRPSVIGWFWTGWVADEVTRYAFVFCKRGNDRVCISIECFEPGTAPIGHRSMIGRNR
jgi:hypothetical protein